MATLRLTGGTSAGGQVAVLFSAPVPDRAYMFGQDARREDERLAAVERAFDRSSQSALIEVGVRPGWHCWEVGAGRGSVARWLAGIVGPEGTVLATDLDEERFDAGTGKVAFARHDVTADPPPQGNLDLVHARFLLEHLAHPRVVIGRLGEALRPGGALVLEDSAGLHLEVRPRAPVFDQLPQAWERAGRSQGWRATYGLNLMTDLRAAGLVEPRGRQYRRLAPGGEEWTHLGYGIQRLHAELIEQGMAPRELEHALHCLSDPGNLIKGPPITIAWARRGATGSDP
jgi:ubiquinone/menaquinone biosynthesis C-methylase UbiE